MSNVEPIRDLETIKRIKEILKNTNYRDFLLFTLGINSGLRISDLLKLKVKDVKNKDFIEIKEQKTRKYKRFPVQNDLKYIIDKFIKNLNSEEWLFKSRKGNNHITRIQAYRIIKNVCIQGNIKSNSGTHTLRKTFGYHFYKQTKDIALLQSILNHSSPSVTMRYIGINQDIIDNSLMNFAL